MKWKISVIVPIFNIEKYVAECIESILQQSYSAFEILLCNDGSTDSSLEICKRYNQKYPDIIIILNKENGGLSSARNAGIKNSNGDYCYFVDGDDLIHRDTLKSFVEILNKYGTMDFIYGRMSSFINDDIETIKEWPWYLDNAWNMGVTDGKTAFASMINHQGAVAMGVRGLYKRLFLLDNGLLFIERKCSWPEDEEWTPRVFGAAKRVAGNDKPFYYYRENRFGSETTKLRNIETAILTIEIYRDYIETAKKETENFMFRKALIFEGSRRFFNYVNRSFDFIEDRDKSAFAKEISSLSYIIKYYHPKSVKEKILKYILNKWGGYTLLYNIKKERRSAN